jgi:DNA-directed RNA polymerase I subunit RPA2
VAIAKISTLRDWKGLGMAAHSFETLKREKAFSHPSSKGHVNPVLDQLAAPHIESFNSLFDDSGLERGDTDGKGLLTLGLRDIGKKVVFSGAGSSPENPMGARLASTRQDSQLNQP